MNRLLPFFSGSIVKKFIVLICLLALNYVLFAQDLSLGLVAYYKLDGNALDAGPNSLNGTITNVTPTTNSAGQANKAMSFTNTVGAGNPASTSYITLPSSTLLQLGGDKTFSFWMKPYTDVSPDGYYEAIYCYGLCGDQLTWTIYYPGLYSTNGCGGNGWTEVSGYYAGVWQHVVITESSGGQMKLYRNGILLGSGPNQSTNKAYSNIPYIGRYLDASGTLGFRGDLDQFRIYNRVLTQAEITLLSNENNPIATITSFTPDNGYTGSSVTITGTGFTGATAVTFGGTNVASFTVNDDSHITAIVGAGITGTVSVTTPGGTSSSSSNFTYNGYVTVAANGEWNSGATWLGGNVPPEGADKTLNHAVNVHSPVTNSGSVTANTYLNIYSTFTNNGTTIIPGSLQMGDGGVFVNNGTISYGANGTLGYYNSVARTTGDEFPAANGPQQLLVSNLAGVTLHASRTVEYLSIFAGSFTLGDNNIRVGAISYSTSAHYIVTNGTGTLTIKNITSSPILFPVGPSATSYNPITISNGAGDDFSVKIQPTFTNVLNDASKAVNAQWTVSKTGTQTGNNVTLTTQWNASDEAGYPSPTFDRNGSIVIGHYGGSSWNEISASAVSGVGPYTTTVTGVSSFSSFGVGNANAFALSIPTITSFTPDNGYSGTSVTISGTNFTGAASVTVGGTNVALFSVNDDSHITAIVGAGITGTVSVTTAGGTASSTTAFTYNGYVTANDGDWSDGSTWLGGNVPTTGATVTVINSVVVPTPLTNTGTVYINNGGGQLILSSVYTNSGSTTCNNGSIKLNEDGSVAGSAIIYNGTSNSITYAGTTPQTTSSLEFPSTNGPNSLGISNPTSVTLHAPRSISNLFLGLGILTTNNNLTLNNSAGIIRLSGSLADSPIFGSSVYITYLNSSDIITGNEIPVPNTPLQQLAVSASGNVTLNDNVVVDGAVVTNSYGNLILGNKNITTNAVFKSAAGYIITNSTGTLTVKNITSSPILFPVGSSATSYNPVTISNGAGDNFSVSVQSTFTNPPLDASKVINAQWTISKTGAQTGNNVTLTPQWNASNEAGYPTPTFNRNSSIVLGHYGGSSWNEIPASAVSGSGTYTTTVTGVSSFSSFGVGNANAFALSLPTITSFTPDNGYSGTSVTITGTNFTNATAITIGGTNAASFTVNDDSHITAIVGSGITGTVSVTTPGGTASSTNSFTYNGYITANDGDWSDGATWVGGNVPTDGASVTINHIVTMDISPTVSNGNTMIVNGTLNCGYNIVSGTGSTIINGIVKTPNGAGFSGATNTSFTNTLSSLTLGPSSTVEYNGVFNTVISENDYANLTSSSVGGRLLPQGRIGISGVFIPGSNTWGTLYASSTVEFNGTDPQDIPAIPYDNLTLSNTGIKTLSNTADSIVVGGNITIGSSSTLNASVSFHIKGNWINDGFLSNNNNFIQFNGVTSQTITGTYPTTFRDIFVSNEAGIYLNKDIRISNGSQLVFGRDGTKIHTGTNRVVLENGANVFFDNNPSTYIHGSLQMTLSSSDSYTTKYFKIGDATTYCPVTMDFLDVNGSQDIVVSPSEPGDHPNISASSLNANKSVNRYWKLTSDYAISFAGTYDVTFEFSPADIDGGANSANFKIGMYSDGAWTYPTTVYIDATHIKATGISGFGDFAIAEEACTEPLVTNQPLDIQPVCQNATPTDLTVTATGDGLNYQWYSNTVNSNSGGTSLNPLGTSPGFTPFTNTPGTLYYYCIVTGDCGVATSNVSEIIVNPIQTYYQDADGDGFGSPNVSIQSCTQPAGYVTTNTDCDDNDNSIYPGAPELCDGKDNDCNGQIDDGIITPSVSISIPSSTICSNDVATFTASSNNSGSSPVYYFRKNGFVFQSGSSNIFDIVNLQSGDVITCDLKSSAPCASPQTVTSNAITMTVNYAAVYYQDADGDGFGNPNISMQSCTQPLGYVTNNADCDDTKLLYADNDGDGYGAGTPVGCGVANNTDCDDNDPNVYPQLPFVDISGDFFPSNGICAGLVTTFTATPFYGGNAPSYQWMKNDVNVGANSNTYSDGSLSDGDRISCVLTSNAACATNTTALSNIILMNVHPLPVVNAGTYSTYTTNDPAFTLSGTPAGGFFSGDGVNSDGNMFDPPIAGPGDHTIYYYYADGNGCGNSASTIIHVTNYTGCTSAPMIGNITGSTTACGIAGTGTSATYSIDNIPGATYSWTKSSSLIQIVGGQNTNSINATFSSNFSSGTITVTVSNACGNTVSVISISKKTPATPGTISGITNPCAYVGTPLTYSIKKVAGATSYTWTVPDGVSITGGTSPYTTPDTSINVTYSSAFTTSSISVNASNACGISAARNLTVTNKIPATPGVISGPTDVCEFIGANANVTYTINKVANATSYEWIIPNGVNIISSSINDTSIVLNFPDTYTTGAIQVKAKSGCGDGPFRSLTVAKKLPGTPGAISGPADVCDFIAANTNVTYTINKVVNATSYQWQIPAGVTIISTNVSDTSIVLNFPDTYTTGAIQVKAKSGCGDGALRSLTVTKKLPGTPGVITPTGDICSSMYAGLNTVTYTIPANTTLPLPTSYVWILIPTISQSAEIVSGSEVISSAGLTVETTGTSIQIQFYGNYTGGTLSVVAKKSCGTSAARKLTLTKNVPPVPAISVLTGTICSGTTSSVYYTASAQPNTDYYIWSSPAGTKIEGSETKSPTRDTTTYNTIVIDYPANFTSGNLTIKGKSVCGTSAVANLAVSSQPCSLLSKNIQGDIEISQEQATAVIYPNPNDGDFMLKIKSANRKDKAQIEITDITGRPIGEYTLSNNNGNMLLHVNNKSLTGGTYILKYKIGNEVKFLKFIIEK